jgi:hypothetical protein
LDAKRTQQPEASLDELLNQTLWDSIQVRRIKLYLFKKDCYNGYIINRCHETRDGAKAHF